MKYEFIVLKVRVRHGLIHIIFVMLKLVLKKVDKEIFKIPSIKIILRLQLDVKTLHTIVCRNDVIAKYRFIKVDFSK